jgi:D-xylose transport system substrate-binding protein
MKIKTLICLLVAAILAFGFVAPVMAGGAQDDGTLSIGISLPTQREIRWVLDRENFEAAGIEQNVSISMQIADNDAAKQQNQCENLITQGVDILIVAPVDGEQAKNIVDMAHAEGIKVIAYDRPILNCDVDLYVTFDQYRIGQLMGEYVVNHLPAGNIVVMSGDPQDPTCVPLKQGAMDAIAAKVSSGDYVIVADQPCRDWSASEAQRHVENALTTTNNRVDAVIAPNDGTAGGAIQALAAQGLAGTTFVTGQDCEPDAIKRIIAGTQSMTVFFDVRKMSRAAVAAAVRMVNGEDAGADTINNNGFKDVPTIGFPASEVNVNTYQELVLDTGYMSPSDIL